MTKSVSQIAAAMAVVAGLTATAAPAQADCVSPWPVPVSSMTAPNTQEQHLGHIESVVNILYCHDSKQTQNAFSQHEQQVFNTMDARLAVRSPAEAGGVTFNTNNTVPTFTMNPYWTSEQNAAAIKKIMAVLMTKVEAGQKPDGNFKVDSVSGNVVAISASKGFKPARPLSVMR